MGETVHRLDAEKLWSDLKTSITAASPSVLTYLYLRFNEVLQTCEFERGELGRYVCAEQGYTLGGELLLISAALSATLAFWIVVAVLQEVFPWFVDRYIVCEEIEDSDGGENR